MPAIAAPDRHCISSVYCGGWHAGSGGPLGQHLGLRIPKDIAARVGLTEGARVDVTAEGDRVVIAIGRPRYRLEELLAGMTPDAMHEAFDWGPDLGREAVE
jgi:antitoxin MazE